MLNDAGEPAIELLVNGYSLIHSKAKYKSIYRKERPDMVSTVAEVSDSKVFTRVRPSNVSSRLKILTSKQMLQRFPIAFARLKAGNTSENLLNEIHQIIYSLYRAKEITKKYITI